MNNSTEIKTVCRDLSGVQCLLGFAHDAIYQASDGGLRLDEDSQDGLLPSSKQCKERTQAAIGELHACALAAERAASGKF